MEDFARNEFDNVLGAVVFFEKQPAVTGVDRELAERELGRGRGQHP